MKKYISFFLIAGLISLASGEEFSQVAETGNNTSKLFNEGGYVRGITPARSLGLVELALGLSSLIIAIRAKKRLAKARAKTALTLGLVAIIFCVVHLITTSGAIFGSGSGKAGSIIALILGLIGAIIAFLTLRSIKTNERH